MSQTPTSTPSLSGPKILLQGDSGAGKTYSLGTLVDWAAAQKPTPLEVFVLFTENGLETLLGYWRDSGKEVPACLHWHVIPAPTLSLVDLMDAAKKTGLLSYEALTKQAKTPQSDQQNAYLRVLQALADFPDDRTGKKFGNIGSWGADHILCVDSMTMLADACMKMVIGNKPTASPPDYGVAQNNFVNLLRYLTQSLAATFVITSHLDRQTDEMTGAVKLMTKSIGKALAADIPPMFSEVILATREGSAWYWDTAAASAVTKTRYLPIASKQRPDFATILDKWRERSKA